VEFLIIGIYYNGSTSKMGKILFRGLSPNPQERKKELFNAG